MSNEMQDGVDGTRPWILTTSKVEFDLVNPNAEMVYIEDLVSASGGIERFTGHGLMNRPLTIAQHSVLVYDILLRIGYRLDQQALLEGLAHDLHEVYVTDASRPLKVAMRLIAGSAPSPYDIIETRCKTAVAQALGLRMPHGSHVILADVLALAWEADYLWGEGTAASWNLAAEAEQVSALGSFSIVPRDQAGRQLQSLLLMLIEAIRDRKRL